MPSELGSVGSTAAGTDGKRAMPKSRRALRNLVTQALLEQGFKLSGKVWHPPPNHSKDDVRRRHEQAVQHNRVQAQKTLGHHEPKLLGRIADGFEIEPDRVDPEIVVVEPGSQDELLFRYAALHWSIPVSSGYGRRLRFLVTDRNNGKLIGIIGLGDPVFSIKTRDEWVGWNHETRKSRLRYVMDAFVLGAVPPYSSLLCGKLIALLVTCDEIRLAFKEKYGRKRQATLISRNPSDGRLALITTVSALGRSSVYNRLKFRGEKVFASAGYTGGWGEVYFSNGLYAPLHAYATKNLEPTLRNSAWGEGFRNRQETIQKCLEHIGMSQQIRRHRIEREVFVVPLARNAREFLSGQHSRLYPIRRTKEELSEWFKERWLLRRAASDKRYANWKKSDWRLWNN